jgi:hypothetical protein
MSLLFGSLNSAGLSTSAIEFWPDGTAHADTGAANRQPVIASPGV